MISMIAVAMACISFFSTAAFALDEQTPVCTVESNEISVLTEETEWRFRTYNGVNQMRLWSITRRLWLTDWINM